MRCFPSTYTILLSVFLHYLVMSLTNHFFTIHLWCCGFPFLSFIHPANKGFPPVFVVTVLLHLEQIQFISNSPFNQYLFNKLPSSWNRPTMWLVTTILCFWFSSTVSWHWSSSSCTFSRLCSTVTTHVLYPIICHQLPPFILFILSTFYPYLFHSYTPCSFFSIIPLSIATRWYTAFLSKLDSVTYA